MLKFFLINIALINFFNSIIIIPLYHQPKKLNISSSYEFINNYIPNNLYSIIKAGTPPQNIEMIITEDDIIFSVRKNKCLLKNYFFNYNTSKSFKIIKESSKFYRSIEAKDTFYFNNNLEDISSNELSKVDNIGFILEKEINPEYSDNLKYNCVVLSLNLFRYNMANNDYNFIIELKKLGFIENHVWTIKYLNEFDKNKNANTNLEGYLIIGDYPHIYEKDKEKYNSLNQRSCLNDMNEKGWNLLFRNITINNDTILTHYMTGIISFSNNYIKGTEEYKSKISNEFFKKYIEKNICFDDNTNSHYFLYYCKKSDFNQDDINSFPDLNFFHAELNYTFKFRGKDLFLENNKFYYFLIIFDIYDYKTWTFGKIFLQKYQLIFDHSSKKINFYINEEEKKEINDNNNNNNLYINNKTLLYIMLACIAVIRFIIGLILGKNKFGNKKRNKKANELDNDNNNDYFSTKKEYIIDSNDATNTSEEKNIN